MFGGGLTLATECFAASQILNSARKTERNLYHGVADRIAEVQSTMMHDGMSWMMGGMGLVWLLTIIVLVLAAAAAVKYLLR